MKLTVICPGCRGIGSVRKIRFLKTTCTECQGSGKISKTITEYKMY
ncbi:hypothetical protein [Jeotgalibacillus haloalkalitolerans]|uniref:Molecular chaperone DnaJ n=1 Tax=Jeotgalibacillus haloalkalitolerans TaxID=3104292 RepID=A0ABU5KMA8_9BACL|nr:hypothetical protein [Jeotgalibacillus sp. HH7-29]MDZ5712300.1 hypothetical protein [Jeotgalibacillus sp. HH7-29]